MRNSLKVFFKAVGKTIAENASNIIQALMVGGAVLAINDALHERNFISDGKVIKDALDEMKDEAK